ncbi:MAG: PAC2 family protein, partial [Candidatus Ratteibacteria bacterium]|nr:PAC2 family protein [Candidatus Ratteibacteria bacterium]
ETSVKRIREIPSDNYSPPTAITATKSIIQPPYFPKNKFYLYKDKNFPNDIILFLGEAQPSPSKQYALAQEIVNFAKKMKVELIYTLAGMLIYEEKADRLKVWGVATDSQIIEKLKTYDITPMKEAYIGGLNGLLLGVAKEAGIGGVCLLAELPFYALQIEYAPSCLASLEVLSRIFNLKIDMKDMQLSSADIKQQIQKLMAHIRQSLIEEEAEELQEEVEQEEDISEKLEKELGISSEIPVHIKYRIENLFAIAKKDTKKALELKALLDKWELFKYYEDRFLDLFKKENQ